MKLYLGAGGWLYHPSLYSCKSSVRRSIIIDFSLIDCFKCQNLFMGRELKRVRYISIQNCVSNGTAGSCSQCFLLLLAYNDCSDDRE